MKHLKYIVLLTVTGLFFQSCFDDDITDFGNGPNIVQFQNLSTTQNFLQDGSGTVFEYEIPVEVFGGDGLALSRDIEFSISVDQASSTAVEGTHFDLLANSFVIPAGSYSANAAIKVYADNLDAANPPVAVLQIDESTETVSDNSKTKVTLQAVCPSMLAGNYTYANGNQAAVTLTETGTGTYSVSRDNAFRGEYPIYISDVCGNISITGGFLPENFGIGISGNGSIADDGSITLIYTVDGYFDNRPMVLVPN